MPYGETAPDAASLAALPRVWELLDRSQVASGIAAVLDQESARYRHDAWRGLTDTQRASYEQDGGEQALCYPDIQTTEADILRCTQLVLDAVRAMRTTERLRNEVRRDLAWALRREASSTTGAALRLTRSSLTDQEIYASLSDPQATPITDKDRVLPAYVFSNALPDPHHAYHAYCAEMDAKEGVRVVAGHPPVESVAVRISRRDFLATIGWHG